MTTALVNDMLGMLLCGNGWFVFVHYIMKQAYAQPEERQPDFYIVLSLPLLSYLLSPGKQSVYLV